MGGAPGLILGGASSLISGAINKKNASSAARDQIAAQYGLMNYQQQNQKELMALHQKNQMDLNKQSNDMYRQNLMDSSMLQTLGMRKAGLNLQFMNGVNPVASAPSGAAASGSASSGSAGMAPIQTEPVNAASGASALSEIPVNEAGALVSGVDYQRKMIDLTYANQVNDANLRLMNANIDSRLVDIDYKKEQLHIVRETSDSVIRKALLVEENLRWDTRLKGTEDQMRQYELSIEAYKALRFPEFFSNQIKLQNSELSKISALISNLKSGVALNYSQAQLNNANTLYTNLQRTNLGFQTIVAGATYKQQIATLTARLVLEKQQADRTYVPTKEEQELMFNYELDLKRLDKEAKQFGVDMQLYREIKSSLLDASEITKNVIGTVVFSR